MRKPGQQTVLQAGLFGMVEQPAQQLQDQHLEQAIGEQALTALHARGLGEQQLEGLPKAFHLTERQHQHRWQRGCQRMVRATVEIECRADEVGAVLGRVLERVLECARIEQQGRLVELHPGRRSRTARMQDGHLAALEQVQKGAPGLRIEAHQTAKRTVVE